MLRLPSFILAGSVMLLFLSACDDDAAKGRTVRIVQGEEDCQPGQVAAAPGERIRFVIENESGSEYEFFGADGADLDPVRVAPGGSRERSYTAPNVEGARVRFDCRMSNDGPSTLVELLVTAGEGESAATASPAGSGSPAPGASAPADRRTPGAAATPIPELQREPDAVIGVTLLEYDVSAERDSVPAGRVRFIATNVSREQAHQLNVLRILPDGSFGRLDGTGDIAPGQGGSVTLDLSPGTYQLACLIARGDAGSDVDHYQQGMFLPFTVSE
ncbi:MAG TPA: hypothetical protein VNM91_08900 [Dehalococcoidia bacterium]|nr:hypothetical protein [Dehalococcoidia bacterium]